MNKQEIVCWSGGMDSTLIAYKLLNKGHKVTLLNFNSKDLSTYEEDNKSRQFFLQHFKKYYPNQVKYEEIDVEFFNNSQLPHWAAYIGLYVKKTANIHIGYIQTSWFWHVKPKFEEIVYNLLEIKDIYDCNLIYDNEWKTKSEIIKKAKSIGIYDKCTITCKVEEEYNE